MFSSSVDWDFSVEDMLAKFGLEPGGPVQCAIMDMCIEYMEPYWAWRTGTLAQSAYADSDYENGIIIYGVDYANKMYYGMDESGRAVQYNTSIHPLAGPYPFERMKADHLNDIVEEARRVAAGEQY